MSKEMNFEPLIKRKRKTSTLETKKVEIAGTNAFSRMPITDEAENKTLDKPTGTIKEYDKQKKEQETPHIAEDGPSFSPSEITKVIDENDTRKKALRTAKVSDDVLLKINTLKPYLKNIDNIQVNPTKNHSGPTTNDIINYLIDSYIMTRLDNRQMDGYQAMYKNLYEEL